MLVPTLNHSQLLKIQYFHNVIINILLFVPRFDMPGRHIDVEISSGISGKILRTYLILIVNLNERFIIIPYIDFPSIRFQNCIYIVLCYCNLNNFLNLQIRERHWVKLISRANKLICWSYFETHGICSQFPWVISSITFLSW